MHDKIRRYLINGCSSQVAGASSNIQRSCLGNLPELAIAPRIASAIRLSVFFFSSGIQCYILTQVLRSSFLYAAGTLNERHLLCTYCYPLTSPHMRGHSGVNMAMIGG